ncbi:MAG: DNA mismatch repair endonuclease MutL [Armatimonadota bacterium]|nr:DNA mismatch repair endonuclease MutL [Armatimonadota bacterium]
MRPIRVLDRSVADRIAAGEVVERPASVVKELIENSLDAGARSIGVEVEGAGLRLIRVIDDGAGIAGDQVRLAFERFATSKIERLEDLDTARSFGFRGEALPSIAAVSAVSMTTRTPDAPSAVRLVVTAGEVEAHGPHGAPPGTVVEVTRLFFNTPARLKFLKSPSREQALIAEVVERAALSNPEVAFRLMLDGREAGWWPRTTALQRAADLLSAGTPAELVAVDGEIPHGRLTGWLGRPERGRPNRTGQHLFVNRRPIQSAVLRRAVEQGYAQLLPVGRFPVFAVFLEIDPASVDVNVHPRKLEVRFRDENRVFGAVVHLVRRALMASSLVRRAETHDDTFGAPVGAGPTAGDGGGVLAALPTPFVSLTLEARESREAYAPAPARLPALRPLGQLLNTYIVAEGSDGLYLVDQHAAHERVLYERILAARRRGGLTSQTLAVPLTLEVTPAQMALVAGHLDVLAAMGYTLEPFGARTLLLRAVPALAATTAPDGLLHRALGALAGEGEGDDLIERLSIATACHTAIRAGDRLSADAVTALLVDLAGAEDPYTCFHGRPTVVAVSRTQLERWFLRG